MSDPTVVLDARVVTGPGGGPEKTILSSPRFLEPVGYRMICAYMRPPGDPGFEQLRSRAQALGALLLPVDDRGPWDLKVLGDLLAICRRERVAIWHGHDYKSNLFGLMLRRQWPMRLVTTVHGWVERTWRTPLYYTIDRLTLRRYERVLCVSSDLHERCLALGVPERRCLLIENGIDTEMYMRRIDSAEAKQRLGLPPGRLVVGAVGRLSPEKGFDVLIRAIDRIVAGGLDVALVIAGEGGQQAELDALAGTLGRSDRIHLLGYQADPRSLYEAMDVFALSSYREGLPNVLLEAMAMGVPVVATRVAGIPRLIRPEENGLLVKAGNVVELADALARLLGDKGSADRFRLAGRAMIEAGYSFEARMGKVRAIYDQILRREVAA